MSSFVSVNESEIEISMARISYAHNITSGNTHYVLRIWKCDLVSARKFVHMISTVG